jgi:hypothetical protein
MIPLADNLLQKQQKQPGSAMRHPVPSAGSVPFHQSVSAALALLTRCG